MCNLKTGVLLILILICSIAVGTVFAQTESKLLQQLRADYYSLLDAMEEYEIAGEDFKMSASEKEDYYHWINRLREQFSATCHAFSQQPNLQVSADIPCDEYASSYQAPMSINIDQERTDGEKTAIIAGEFTDSLGDFDEKLLREQDRVKAMRPQNTSAQTGGGTGSGESGEGDGGSSGDGESEQGEQKDQQADQPSGGQTAEQSEQQGRDQRDDGARGRPQPGKKSSAPEDIPDGSDDDVVARQLREAAEMETDPELKAKLWEEYRRYKKGQ